MPEDFSDVVTKTHMRVGTHRFPVDALVSYSVVTDCRVVGAWAVYLVYRLSDTELERVLFSFDDKAEAEEAASVVDNVLQSYGAGRY